MKIRQDKLDLPDESYHFNFAVAQITSYHNAKISNLMLYDLSKLK